MQATKPTLRPESKAVVLFDEDYRAHIAKLDRMLDRERAEVIRLREENYRLKNQRK